MNNLNNTYNTESRGVAMNIFAVLGFIAILLAGLWATIQLVKQVTNFSFDFATPKIKLPGLGTKSTLVLNSTGGDDDTNIATNSGAESLVSWEINDDFLNDTTGNFSFSYACKKGIYLKAKKTPTAAYKAIPCNTTYPLPAKSTALSIIPVISNTKSKEVYNIAYTVVYTNKDGEQIAHGKMKVDAAAGTLAHATPAKTVTPSAATPAPKKVLRKVIPVRKSDINGRPDLAIKILSVLPTATPGKVAVKFEVANLGTKLVNGWNFTAQLPTTPAYAYTSGPQVPLYAGERAEIVITFDKVAIGNKQLTLALDANNVIAESSENNNTASQVIVRN